MFHIKSSNHLYWSSSENLQAVRSSSYSTSAFASHSSDALIFERQYIFVQQSWSFKSFGTTFYVYKTKASPVSFFYSCWPVCTFYRRLLWNLSVQTHLFRAFRKTPSHFSLDLPLPISQRINRYFALKKKTHFKFCYPLWSTSISSGKVALI